MAKPDAYCAGCGKYLGKREVEEPYMGPPKIHGCCPDFPNCDSSTATYAPVADETKLPTEPHAASEENLQEAATGKKVKVNRRPK